MPTKKTTKTAAAKAAPKTTTEAAPPTDAPAPKDIGQTPGYAGAILDPRTLRAVMPGENVDGPDAPALPAPKPEGAPE